MKRFKNTWQKGQSLIEMAFGSVVLIILLGGLMDVGRAFIILVSVENATGEGALYGSTNPECLTDSADAGTTCSGRQSIYERIREEGRPVVNLTDDNSEIHVYLDDTLIQSVADSEIEGGKTLTVEVRYQYSPITPIGFLIWGETAEIFAEAHQEVLSPPRPGYDY